MALEPVNDTLAYTDSDGRRQGAPLVTAQPPLALLTDGGTGPNARLRVDVGQTGFFAGRSLRAYYELNIAGNTSIVIRMITTVDIILEAHGIDLSSGSLRMESVTGGTPGGTWNTPIPTRLRNTMSEVPAPYTPVAVLATGGTHTGGTVWDLDLLKADLTDPHAFTVASVDSDDWGLPAGTYYFRLSATTSDAVVGLLRMSWEERLP